VEIEVETAGRAVAAPCSAIPMALERLVLNLLDNAIKYNRPEGRITVRLSRTDGEALLEVTDTGIGIPPESIPRLFERFYRVDKGRAREEGRHRPRPRHRQARRPDPRRPGRSRKAAPARARRSGEAAAGAVRGRVALFSRDHALDLEKASRCAASCGRLEEAQRYTMKKLSGKKISLNRETLRQLSSTAVREAAGGVFTNVRFTICESCTFCSDCGNTCTC